MHCSRHDSSLLSDFLIFVDADGRHQHVHSSGQVETAGCRFIVLEACSDCLG